MQYSLYINQLFVANHPECEDLDIIDIAIFDCVRKLIAGNWGEKKLEDGVLWANVRIAKISQEMPLLRNGKGNPFKPRAIHGRISKLCEAGLLQKWEHNQKKVSSFIALGQLAKEYDSYTKPLQLDANPIASTCNPPLHLNANNKNTIQKTISNTISPTPLDGGSVEPPTDGLEDLKKVPKAEKRITFEKASKFYQAQLKDLPPLPEDQVAAAAEQRRRDGYAKLIKWMAEGDDESPETMQATVMTMGSPLTYIQLGKLIDTRKLTGHQIKHYLRRMHNWTENKNRSIYDVIVRWHNDDIKANKVPPAKPVNGLPAAGGVTVKRPSSTNNDYSAA